MLFSYPLFTPLYEVSVNTLPLIICLNVLLNFSETMTDSQFSLGCGSFKDGSSESVSLICLLPYNTQQAKLPMHTPNFFSANRQKLKHLPYQSNSVKVISFCFLKMFLAK